MEKKYKYPMIVTAAIIENDGKFLITQRLEKSHNGLRWEFPGGKISFGEEPREALEREVKEELGIEIKAGSILDLSSNVYGDVKHVVLIGMHCNFISGEIEKHGINDFTWISLEEMKDYNITEADLPFIEKLKNKKS